MEIDPFYLRLLRPDVLILAVPMPPQQPPSATAPKA